MLRPSPNHRTLQLHSDDDNMFKRLNIHILWMIQGVVNNLPCQTLSLLEPLLGLQSLWLGLPSCLVITHSKHTGNYYTVELFHAWI